MKTFRMLRSRVRLLAAVGLLVTSMAVGEYGSAVAATPAPILLNVLKGHGDRVVAIDFNNNGQVGAASGVTRWGNGFGASLHVFTSFRQDPFKIGAQARWSYSCVAISPQGRLVALLARNIPPFSPQSRLEP